MFRYIATYCCPRCGWVPDEGMIEYIRKYRLRARCRTPTCGKRFAWEATR